MNRFVAWWRMNWDFYALWAGVFLLALVVSWILGAFDDTATGIRSGY